VAASSVNLRRLLTRSLSEAATFVRFTSVVPIHPRRASPHSRLPRLNVWVSAKKIGGVVFVLEGY
jgi:hypothetical protein